MCNEKALEKKKFRMKEHQDVQKNERNTSRHTKLNTQVKKKKNVTNECLANFLPHITVALACCIPLGGSCSLAMLHLMY